MTDPPSDPYYGNPPVDNPSYYDPESDAHIIKGISVVGSPEDNLDIPQYDNRSYGRKVASLVGSILKTTLSKAGLGYIGDIFNLLVNSGIHNSQFKKNNEEYDRRWNQTNAYNEKWADRLRAQGLNPLSAISQGVTSVSASMAAPNAFSGPLSNLGNYLSNELTSSQIDLNKQNFTQSAERFPVSLYGEKLSNMLNEFEYNEAQKRAPLILEELSKRIEKTEQEITNLKSDDALKVADLANKEQELLNLRATESLIKAQEVLANAGVALNNAQIGFYNEQTKTQEWATQYTKAEAEDLANHVISRLESGFYATVSDAESKRIAGELKKLQRVLWDRPDDSTVFWYVGNLFWNIQNCLTLSASGSASVPIKK